MIINLDYTGKSLEEIYRPDENDIIIDNNNNIIHEKEIERSPKVVINGVTFYYYRTSKLAEKLAGHKVTLEIDITTRKLEFTFK